MANRDQQVQKRQQSLSCFFQKATTVYLLSMGGLFVLFTGDGYTHITMWKTYLFYGLTGSYVVISLLGRVALMLVGVFAPVTPATLWKGLRLSQKLVLGFWLFSLCSTLLSAEPHTAFWGGVRHEGFLTITLYCWTYLLISASYTPQKWLIWVFGAAMSLCCILSILQFLGYNPLGLYPQGITYYDGNTRYSGEFLGTFGNADLFSAVLCLAIPLFWLSVLLSKDQRRFLLLIPLALCLVVLCKAFVAGGIVGVSASILLTIPVLAREKKRRLTLLGVVLLVLVLGIFLVYFLGGRAGGFVGEAAALLHGRWDDDFGSGRLYIWRKSMELVPQRPLFGGGPDTLGLRTDAAFERYDEALGFLIRNKVDVAHNEYLNILVNQGLFALAAYLGALCTIGIRWVRRAPHDLVSTVCGGAVLCYCIQAFFGISSPISAPLFWICLGLTDYTPAPETQLI